MTDYLRLRAGDGDNDGIYFKSLEPANSHRKSISSLLTAFDTIRLHCVNMYLQKRPKVKEEGGVRGDT